MTDSRQDAVGARLSPRNRYAHWLRTLPGPLAILVQSALLFTLTFGMLTLADVAWPHGERIDWAHNLVVAAGLAVAMGLGELVAEARYGRDVLAIRGSMHWRAFGLFVVVVLLVAIGLNVLTDRLFG